MGTLEFYRTRRSRPGDVSLRMVVENAKATANYSPFTQRCIGEAEARGPDVFRVMETSGSRWGNGGQQLGILNGNRHPSHLIGRHSSRPYQAVAFDR